MFQRLLIAFSLIVSFGVAQIGAVTHEISHYGDTKSQGQTQDFSQNSDQSQNDLSPDSPLPHQVCEKCFSYAGLGHAVQNADLILPNLATSQRFLSSDSANSSHAKLRSYSARAPPTSA